MGDRGEGRLYLPKWTDKRTGKKKTSAVWWFCIGVGGKKVRASTNCRDFKDAKKWRNERLAQMGRGDISGLTFDKLRFEDLAKMVEAEYVANKRKSLVHLRHSRRRCLATSTPRRPSTSTSRHYNEAFTLAVRAKRLTRDQCPYFPYLEVRNARQGFFERDQLDMVLPHLSAWTRPVIEVAYHTGWRIKSELLTREWRHVDLAAGWLRLDPEETKNRKGRMFPLFPALRAVLEAQRERVAALETELGRVIPWVFPRPVRGARRIVSLQNEWEAARAAAGLPHRIMHDFRRTAVRNLERAAVPRSAAMKMVGHLTEAIYRRYAIVVERDLVAAGERLQVLSDQQPPKKIERFEKRA